MGAGVEPVVDLQRATRDGSRGITSKTGPFIGQARVLLPCEAESLVEGQGPTDLDGKWSFSAQRSMPLCTIDTHRTRPRIDPEQIATACYTRPLLFTRPVPGSEPL